MAALDATTAPPVPESIGRGVVGAYDHRLLLGLRQVGVVYAAGQNVHRMRNEATFAKLCAVAPRSSVASASGIKMVGGVRDG